jgi:hypothetical protein
MSFEKELEQLINCHSVEDESDTPDFILTQYIRKCLDTWNETTRARDKWYNFKGLSVTNSANDQFDQTIEKLNRLLEE